MKSHPAISSDSTACRYLRLSALACTMRSSLACVSESALPSTVAVKPSKRLRHASAPTAFFGQPTTVSMFRSDGGMEIPRSFSTFSPS